MPTEEGFDPDFPYAHYTWEHNINFIHYGGSFAGVVKYNLPDWELYPLLMSLNGIYFTGGPLDLFDKKTGKQHIYYQTARKIIKWAITRNSRGHHFPIFAICQGFEIMHLVMNDDRWDDTMEDVVDLYATSRPLIFSHKWPQ